MSDPMQEIRDSFFIECEELLEALQDALAEMEGGANDSETINVAFRAVHSIKGGAGAFGLDQLVGFAHKFETAMDFVRSGELTAEADTVSLFFQCGDALSDLVRVSRDGEELPEDQLEDLLTQLSALTGDEEEEEEVDFTPAGLSLDLPGLPDLPDLPPLDAGADADDDAASGGEIGDGPLLIRFVPEPELYRSGNEPYYLLRALAGIGDARITCEVEEIPDLGEAGAETSILAWTIELETDLGEEGVREVFDFVDGLCTLDISAAPPRAPDPDGTEGSDSTEGPEETGSSDDMSSDATTVPEGDAHTATAPESGEPAVAKETKAEVPAAAKASAQKPPANAKSGSSQGATVRVDLDRIDRLVNLVGELVINQAMLAQSVAASGMGGNTKIMSGLDEFQQLTRDIQDSVMMIRAQPVKSLFQRMGRIVREASAEVKKTVRLETEGESTEIDKTVIERLADPLTHMIRNAVDHGLEPNEKRVANGKPETGTVTLTAGHRSGRVIIEIADDGGGINREKVKAKAEEKGLIPAGQDLSDAEIDNLLFLPGFSTASTISNISGRGVGMDVVKSSISALGGRISIASAQGEGTTFSISLPLTLAVLDGMVVEVRNETLVIPISAVSETLSIGPTDVSELGPQSTVVRVRDQFIPLIDLGTELGYSDPRESYEGAIVLLISQEDGTRAALVVDEIEDQRQVVIKGLEEAYGRVPGVAAATILGDGQIALILDPADLLANASGIGRPALAMAG